MKCPKCRGPMTPGYIGEMACIICGNRVYEPLNDFKMRQEPKVEHVERQKKSRERLYVPCPVCGRRMLKDSPHPYCSACATSVRNWGAGKMTTPCPIVQIDGRWQWNPKRMQGAAA